MAIVRCARAALTLLALLVQLVRAEPQQACGTDSKGVKVGPPIYLNEVDMRASVRDWYLTVPSNVCGSPFKYVVGMTATTCDYDLPPQVTVYDDLMHAYIHRTGNLALPGKIYTVVYCAGGPYRRRSASDVGTKLVPAQEYAPAVPVVRSVV